MKKILLILIAINYLYALPSCKNYQETGICYYKGSMNRSIVVLNMQNKPIIFNAKIIKDNYLKIHDIKNVKLGAYQRFKIEEKFYYDSKYIKNENLKFIFNYKIDDLTSPINIYKDVYSTAGKNLERIKTTKKVLSRVQNRNNNIKVVQAPIIKKQNTNKIIITQKDKKVNTNNIYREIKKNTKQAEQEIIKKQVEMKIIRNKNTNTNTNKIVQKREPYIKKEPIQEEKIIPNKSVVLKLLFKTLIATIVIVFIYILLFRKNKSIGHNDELDKISKLNEPMINKHKNNLKNYENFIHADKNKQKNILKKIEEKYEENKKRKQKIEDIKNELLKKRKIDKSNT